MARFDALHMIKRRAEAAAPALFTCSHSFRATAIATYLKSDLPIEWKNVHVSPGFDLTGATERQRRLPGFDASASEIERIIVKLELEKEILADPDSDK